MPIIAASVRPVSSVWSIEPFQCIAVLPQPKVDIHSLLVAGGHLFGAGEEEQAGGEGPIGIIRVCPLNWCNSAAAQRSLQRCFFVGLAAGLGRVDLSVLADYQCPQGDRLQDCRVRRNVALCRERSLYQGQ